MVLEKAIKQFISMWPREIWDIGQPDRKRLAMRGVDGLNEPGVYVLYRNDQPYYIGQANKLFDRIHAHANKATDRYFNFWNFFSAFVVTDPKHLSEVETILIAAMPTANSSRPRMSEIKMPREIAAKLRENRRHQINPVTRKDFDELRRRLGLTTK